MNGKTTNNSEFIILNSAFSFYAQKFHKIRQKGIKSARRNSVKNVDYCSIKPYNIRMENNSDLLSEYVAVLGDSSFRLTAERLIMKCGVRSDLKGSNCLVDAIILYGTELCTGFCEIYRIIGEVRGIKPKSVMREISYAIVQAFGIVERLSKLVGVPLTQNDIHSGLVIAYLGKIFKHPDLALYA